MHIYICVCVCVYIKLYVLKIEIHLSYSFQSNKSFSLVFFFIYNIISPFPPIIFQNMCAFSQSPVYSPSSHPTGHPHS